MARLRIRVMRLEIRGTRLAIRMTRMSIRVTWMSIFLAHTPILSCLFCLDTMRKTLSKKSRRTLLTRLMHLPYTVFTLKGTPLEARTGGIEDSGSTAVAMEAAAFYEPGGSS